MDNGRVESLEFQLCTDCCMEVAFKGMKYELITDIKHLSILVYLYPADILSEVAEFRTLIYSYTLRVVPIARDAVKARVLT